MPAALYPLGRFLVLISVKRVNQPQGHNAVGKVRPIENPITSPGFEPVTFQLVAQCLNQLCYHMPPYIIRYHTQRNKDMGLLYNKKVKYRGSEEQFPQPISLPSQNVQKTVKMLTLKRVKCGLNDNCTIPGFKVLINKFTLMKAQC
jgi:hypothetical protein